MLVFIGGTRVHVLWYFCTVTYMYYPNWVVKIARPGVELARSFPGRGSVSSPVAAELVHRGVKIEVRQVPKITHPVPTDMQQPYSPLSIAERLGNRQMQPRPKNVDLLLSPSCPKRRVQALVASLQIQASSHRGPQMRMRRAAACPSLGQRSARKMVARGRRLI